MSRRTDFRHLVPLLLFTALVVIAAGITMAVAVVHLLQPASLAFAMPLLVTAFALTATGGAISLLHLGRKERAGRAVLGLAHSWLSREAFLSGVFAAATLTALVVLLFGLSPLWYTIAVSVASASGLFMTVAVGKLYDLGAQAGWRGMAQVLTPPVAALLLCSALICMAPGGTRHAAGFYGLWLADMVLLALRRRVLARNLREGAAFSFPVLSRVSSRAYWLRTLVSAAAVVLFALPDGPAVVVAVIAVVIVLDRFCLYGAAARSTPAGEMARLRAERLQAARPPARRPEPSSPPDTDPTQPAEIG
jgi:DMSO reductase anchor subunit